MKPILLRILILSLFLKGTLFSFETITPTEYQNAKNIVIATDIDGNLYTAFQETNNSLNRGKLMEYDGFSWRSIETGIHNSADSDDNFSLPSYYFTNSELLYSEIEFDSNNNLYLLYIDHETGLDPIIGVEKFDENRTLVNYDGLLGAVGLSGNFEPKGFYASLDINSSDNPIIAFVDISGNVSLKYLDGGDNSWKYLENSQDIYSSDEVALAIDNDIPYIAYIDSTSGKISVSKYVQNSWVSVDGNISEGEASNIDIYVDNDKNLYIQYNDLGDNNNSIHAQLLRYDSFNFNENETNLTVGTVNISSTDSYKFSLSGDDSSLFEINSSGTIKFKSSPNFENKLDSNSDNIYTLSVLATNENNVSVEREIRITVTDINDNPILETISSITIPENSSTFTFDINGSDEDNNSLLFSISGYDYGIFSINSSSGVLFLNSPLNFEEKNSYELNITLSDGTADINSSLSITVQNINEIHTVTSDSNRSALEDMNYSLELNISDVDFNSTFTVTDATGSLPSWLTLQQSENYVVSTLAGSGSMGYTDGVGIYAQFKKPQWLTVDQNGNIFVSDYDDYRIRKITPNGIVSTFAGNGSSGYTDGVGTDAQFNRPTGLAFDSNGNLFVSDVFNCRIRKITPDGNVSTFAGSGSMGYTDGVGLNSDFTSPMGLAFDTNDILFVVDGNKIRKITPDGNVSTFAGSSSSGYTDGVGIDARFNEPQDLVFDTNGNLFIADYYNQRVRKITPDRNVSTFVGTDNGTDMDGYLGGYLDGNSTSALFDHLSGLAIDKENNIFVADLTNNRIRKVTPDGNVSTFAGGDSGYTNGSLSLSRFKTPTDLVFDSEGSLFIADLNNAVVRKISLETDNTLTGTPTNDDVGEYNISITISDGELSVDFNTTITVVNVNDAPTLSDDTNLSSISEDVTDSSGSTISSLFSSLFSDIDGDSLSGVAISANSVDSSTAGKWQYSTDSGSNWFDIGTVSESSALLLSSDTLLRFVPVANYNGVPSGLTLYPIDSNTSLSFTSGSSTQTVDTTNDDETSSVGASSQDLNTSIISVNDEPTLSTTGEDPTFVENGSGVQLFSSTSIDDGDYEVTQNIEEIKISFTNISDSNESLYIDGEFIKLSDGNSGTTSANSFSYSISISGTDGNITISKSGTASEYQTLIDGIQYTNSSEDPSILDRVFSIFSIKDSGGVENSGDNINDSLVATSTISITSVNDEPTLTTTGENPTFIENGSSVQLFSNSTFSTVESGQTVSELTLRVSNIREKEFLIIDGEDINLSDGNSGTTSTNSINYSISFSGTTATVIISGNITSSILDAISYKSEDEDPTADNSSRTVTVTEVKDSGGTSDSGDDTLSTSKVSTISITSVNDEPVLKIVSLNPTFIENGSSVQLFSDANLSTVENDQNITEVNLTLSNIESGFEILRVDGTDINLSDKESGTTSNGVNYSVEVSNKTANISIWDKNISNSLLNGVEYKSYSENPTKDSSIRTLTIQTLKDSGGVENGGDDINNSVQISSTISITAVNDLPVIEVTNINNLEDNKGSVNFSFTDAENSSVVAIEKLSPLHGIVSIDGTKIEYQPNENFYGEDSFILKFVDDENGTVERNISVTITPVDDTPVLENIADLNLKEDFGEKNITLLSSDVENDTVIYSAISNDNSIATLSILNNILTVKSVANANGTVYIDVNVSQEKNQSLFDTTSFSVSIEAINDKPLLDPISDINISEDFGQFVIEINGSDIESTALNYLLSIKDRAVFDINISENNITLTSKENIYGERNLTISVNDGELEDNQTILVNIYPVNDTPDINLTDSISLSEDSSKTIPFTYFDAENDELNITISKNGSIGTLSKVENGFLYSPYGNRNGSDLVTVQFDDGFSGVVERNISIIVTAVDDAPTMATISNVTLDEDSSAYSVDLSISDIDSSTTNATVSVSSTNSEIASISTSGKSLIITPVADKSGTASITATATIGGKSVSKTFSLTINPVDDAPILADIGDLTVDEDSETKRVTVSLSDIDSDVTSATYSLTSSNSEIADISISGNIISLTPKENMSGTSTVTVKASLDGKDISKSFNYTINPVDDDPILSSFQSVSNSGTESVNIPISLSDIDSNLADATYSVSSSNPDLVDVSIVDGELVITPKGNLSGDAEITVTATLDGVEVSQTFSYSTERINSAPTIGDIDDIDLESYPDSFSETVSLSLYDDIGVESLSATSSNSKLVGVSSDLENSELTLSIPSNSVGEARITVTATDKDGESSSESFNVKVKANETQVCLENSTTKLTFETIRGENEEQNYIRSSLTLPETLESCDDFIYLTWSSSNEDIIDTFGNIYIDQEKDYTIKLTADIESGGFSSQKSFLLTVPKEELTDEIAVQQAYDVLTFETIRNSNLKKSEIYTDLNLYSEGVSGTSISWFSSNGAISTDGAVSRDSNDTAVTLTATISKNEESIDKLFNLIVKAQKVSDSEIVANDKVWLTIGNILNDNRDAQSIKTPLTLYETGINGSDISWESSNEEIISLSGEVNRDITDRYVELLATLQKGEAIESKNYLLKVLKIVEDENENNTSFNRVEDIDGNETKTISIFLDSDIGEISSTVEIDNNISSTVETIISDESVKTIFETNSSLSTIFLNSDGTAESKIETIDENNNSIESGLKVKVSGGKTTLQSDGTISTSVESKEAEMKSDGTVKHVVTSENGASSVATSKLAGSSVKVSKDGVQTTYEAVSQSESGDKIVLQAIVDTDNSSKSKTSFSLTNLSTGETVELDKTLSDESSFSEGTEIEIDKDNDGKIEIKISTKLDTDLEVE